VTKVRKISNMSMNIFVVRRDVNWRRDLLPEFSRMVR
jgi:hypothetical protein